MLPISKPSAVKTSRGTFVKTDDIYSVNTKRNIRFSSVLPAFSEMSSPSSSPPIVFGAAERSTLPHATNTSDKQSTITKSSISKLTFLLIVIPPYIYA